MKDEWNPPVAMLIFFAYGAFLGLLAAVGRWGTQSGLAALEVAVAFLNTVVLAYIGYQANKLVISSHARDEAKAKNQIRLVLAIVSPEWQAARIKAGVIAGLMGQTLTEETYAGRRVARIIAAQHANQLSLVETEAMLEQLNVLPAPLVDRIGHAIGCVKALKRAANQGAELETPGSWRDEMGDSHEPEPATSEAVELLHPAYRVIASSIRLLDGELVALVEAAHLSAQGKLRL